MIALVVMASYLIGAVPCGIVVARLHSGIDIRAYGSGNIGFANMLRTLGARAAAIVFVADIAKGVVPVLLAKLLIGSPLSEMAAGLAAVIGHNWSVYIKFRGGRGVDTGIGALLAMSPGVALACFAVFGLTLAIFRYISLGSIMGAIAAFAFMLPLALMGWQPIEYFIYASVAALIIIIQHRANIARLRAGKERKIGQRGERRT